MRAPPCHRAAGYRTATVSADGRRHPASKRHEGGTRPVLEQVPKRTSPGCTSPREFRVILLCPTVLFGAQMAATPSPSSRSEVKRCAYNPTIRYLPLSSESRSFEIGRAHV